jgi:tRNA1Val (adenine37-N6)-methyltransferase
VPPQEPHGINFLIMANPYFRFKQFTVHHDRCAMKVTTDSCFFGAWAAEEIKNDKQQMKSILDIGSGTGLLALMIAQKNDANIDAVEINEEAAQQARENVESSLWQNKIAVVTADILNFQTQKKYDCIISNPPFYENELASDKENKNIAHHSKQLTISQVLEFISAELSEEGCFFLMYPFKRQEEMERLCRTHHLHIQSEVILSQSTKHSPFRIIVKGRYIKPGSPTITSIAICDEHQNYTEPFVALLKDYYLYL